LKGLQVSRNLEAQSYCFKKGYKIYPIPEGSEYRIEIDYKGQKKLGEKLYSKKEWYDAIWDLYEKIYAKAKR
jgi:hypothetical protein|tara:strand:+ start:5943 stop:6158 length:216 start_codon:yes stop_codon:yes gene_type:complete